MAKTRQTRAATLILLVDQGDYDALGFIQASGKVHVIAHGTDWPDAEFDAIAFALGDTWTVCGIRFSRHVGGYEQGARRVGHFEDAMLCQRCYAAFGDRSVLIFEANQPADDADN